MKKRRRAIEHLEKPRYKSTVTRQQVCPKLYRSTWFVTDLYASERSNISPCSVLLWYPSYYIYPTFYNTLFLTNREALVHWELSYQFLALRKMTEAIRSNIYPCGCESLVVRNDNAWLCSISSEKQFSICPRFLLRQQNFWAHTTRRPHVYIFWLGVKNFVSLSDLISAVACLLWYERAIPDARAPHDCTQYTDTGLESEE